MRLSRDWKKKTKSLMMKNSNDYVVAGDESKWVTSGDEIRKMTAEECSLFFSVLFCLDLVEENNDINFEN